MNIDQETIQPIREHVERLLHIIHEYDHFLDSFIIEFFIEDHWKKVDAKWRHVFENMEPRDFSNLMFMKNPTGKLSSVLPLSLLAFKSCCLSYGISRHYDTTADIGEFNLIPCQSKMIDHIFRKHVKPKKQHEIRKLAEVILNEAKLCKISRVVDVGSGHGHLSRLLAVGHNIPVSSFELNAKSVSRAKQFDTECIKSAYKKDSAAAKLVEIPRHSATYIEPFLDSDQFCALFQNQVNNERFLLTGLHACGDLSATMIHTFVNCVEVKSLVSISCCYMKLTTSCDVTGRFYGYPMSSYVRSLTDCHLGYKSRATACHANENFADSLRTNGDHLRVHCCRSVLESLIRKLRPEMIRPGVQISQKIQLNDFEKYVEIAFAKLDISDSIPDNVNGRSIDWMLSQWKKVIMYYSLSLLIAPLVETVVLLDRAIYLLENGYPSQIKCIFDPKLSPRCFALISKKQ